MLTLKEPLQLNTVKPISVHSDILGEKMDLSKKKVSKITNNYSEIYGTME